MNEKALTSIYELQLYIYVSTVYLICGKDDRQVSSLRVEEAGYCVFDRTFIFVIYAYHKDKWKLMLY